jgi:hypothetical protein
LNTAACPAVLRCGVPPPRRMLDNVGGFNNQRHDAR